MRRRLLNLLTLLSLLLCVAVAALWVRSHRVVDELSFSQVCDEGYWYIDVASLRGRLGIAVVLMQDPSHGNYYRSWLGWRLRSQTLSEQWIGPWAFSFLAPPTPFGITWYRPTQRVLAQGSLGTDTRFQVIAPLMAWVDHVRNATVLAGASTCESRATTFRWPLPPLRLRPPRHAGQVPGVRPRARGSRDHGRQRPIVAQRPWGS
jgi:hypothetical protein